ncbi:PepSY domain-containing protein [Duncaniella sp.]|uniref:PepSY-associated TM helix domain-containing protein n=1 Tax=Duncaniella sp. TaxID=2518496 RepID=UPI0023BC0A48|nr:PepSY-associated TM helix domain-containing protein [Duncaniella sp.]MDE5905693.1 PepSY domain-containing protein [Duncaniella sp.]
MIKFFRKIHLWLSVPFGIFITLVCFSGAMLIFEPEITRAVKSEVYYVAEVKDRPLPLGELMETVKASLPDSVSVNGVTIFSDASRAYQVSLSKPRRASMFIDQYSGEITGRYERLGFFSVMFKLHRWLLDSANPHGDGIKVGKVLVGISTLVFVIALISGVVIWWPRARKNLRRSLSISFSNGWKGLWKGLHVAGGMYALIFVLAMALTGLTWSFDWYRSAFYAVCGVEHTPRNFGQTAAKSDDKAEQRQGRGGRGGEGREGRGGEGRGGRGGEGRGGGRHRSEFGRWQQVYDELKAQNPDAPQITVGPESASVTLGTIGNGRAADKYEFNRRSGEITPAVKYADSLPADKLRGWIYAVHTGSWGGLFGRILWLLSALLGATLPLTGYYIWIKHFGKKKHHEHIASSK